MKLNVNDFVYYRGVGVCKITEKKEITIMGQTQECIVLKSIRTKMTIMMPTSNIKERPIRNLSEKNTVSEALASLKEKKDSFSSKKNWNQRYKEINSIIQSGEIKKIANVYSELSNKKELSFSEKKIKEVCLDLVTEEAQFVLK